MTRPHRPAAPRRNLPFATFPAQQLLLDVYPPQTSAGASVAPDAADAASAPLVPAPVVLWFHSGGWRSGSKDHCPSGG